MSFTNAQLAQKISDLIDYWSSYITEYKDWLGGSVGGGPGSNGKYPLTDWNGNTSLVDAPAQLADNVNSLVTGAQGYASAASASADAAAASASTATTQAGLADTARIAAETARTQAQTAETGAVDAKVTAIAQANLATDRAGYAQEWANLGYQVPVSVAAGGDGSTTFSAKHWAQIAENFSGSIDSNLYFKLADNEIVTGLPTFNLGMNFLPMAAPAWAEGRVFYDSTEKALSYYNDEADVTINVGQENVIRVRNTTGVTITNGSAVYINGSQGANLPTVALARADALATSRCIGLATHDIENNSNGYVTTLGLVNNLNTSAYSAGDTLYLSTSVAGGLQNSRPTTGWAVVVGKVTVSNVAIGQIKVLPGITVQRADVTSASQNETITGTYSFSNGLRVITNPINTTTPVGSSVPTMIDIPARTLGLFEQQFAVGILAGSASSARVLSVFDARTGGHQPSIGVFSPDETDLFGFSWDGSNTTASIKTVGLKNLNIKLNEVVYFSVIPSEPTVNVVNASFRVYDNTVTDYADFTHDGTNFNTTFTNTTQWNISLPISVTGLATFSDDIQMGSQTGDRIGVYGPLDVASSYAIGIEASTMYYKSASIHRWYVGTNADGGTSHKLALTGSLLNVLVPASITGTLTVSGNSTFTGTGIFNAQSPAIKARAGDGSATFNGDQIQFGHNGTDNYRHAIGTRHNAAADANNAIDFYLWNFGTDAAGSVGTFQVMTLDQTGSNIFTGLGVWGQLTTGAGGLGGDAPLTVRSQYAGAGWNYIQFQNSGGTRTAYLGMNPSNDFVFDNEAGGSFKFLDTLYANTTFVCEGVSTFNNDMTVNGGANAITISAGNPKIRWIESDHTADNKRWDIVIAAGQMRFRALNDAETLSTDWLTVSRSANKATVQLTGGDTSGDNPFRINSRFNFRGDGVMSWGPAMDAGYMSWLSATNALIYGASQLNLGVSADQDNLVLTNGFSTFNGQITVQTTGSQITLYDTDGTDSLDRGLFETNAGATNIYSYDNSAAAWYLGLSVSTTTGNVTVGNATGDVYVGSDLLYVNGKLTISANDTYLRLNQGNAYTSGVYTPYNFRADGTIFIGNGTVGLSLSNGAIKHTTASGWVEVGAQNTSFCHFATDRGQFYMNKPVHVNGTVYDYNGGSARPYFKLASPTGYTSGGNVTYSTSAPSGGSSGDLWFKYT